jgi:DNA-binding transcriptional regulator YdaS (Cro superfamily)
MEPMEEFRQWLKEDRGRAARLAESIGVSQVAVSYWAKDKVPAERVLKVAEFTSIPVEKLRPDMMPETGEAA